jgi:predicted  nucleic acid-binding Zn-ribbon protein
MGTIETNINKTVSKLEGQLELWSAQLKELIAKGDVAGQKAKIDSRKHLDDLKAKLDRARSKLGEAKAAGDDKWDAFKQAIETSWKDLEGSFKQLVH